MSNELIESVEAIRSAKEANQFRNYIDYIQFPFYRNMEINSRISFDYPLTVFIGQNGCGKSSALHAMYGSVEGKTPYEFWFSTEVDPIEYYNDEKKRHSFWYSYRDREDQVREVVKARIQRAGDPNYWETSRPLNWAGMRASQRRNPPIRKNVVYLDFRSELSAFDKFFYFGDVDRLKSKNKQEYIRKRSVLLKGILDGVRSDVRNRRGTLNSPLLTLTDQELECISFVLGRAYDAAKSIKHKIFRFEGYSILYQTRHASYSEAFAGSGEMAVVRLVLEVLNAPSSSLILLDEPEVSLHPGAQENLKFFLLDQIKRKKHQIVLTTHSPTLVKGLPKEAIKVFCQNPTSGRFFLKENLLPEEAFFHIGFKVDSKKQITVEDKLAKHILDAVLDQMGEESRTLIHVKYNPGGASVIKKEFISVYCREDSSREYVLFDGDQKPEEDHVDWKTLDERTLSNLDTILNIVKQQVGVEIKFSVDGGSGGSDDAQKIMLYKKYLDYYLGNVYYLPRSAPEDLIWSSEYANQFIDISYNEGCRDHLKVALEATSSSKEKFALLTKYISGINDSEKISAMHENFICYWKRIESESYNQIKDILRHIIEV
jgi:predicted ATPase